MPWKVCHATAFEPEAHLVKGFLEHQGIRRHAVHEGGDHRIFLGRVEALRRQSTAEPLVVFQGAYRSLKTPEP